MSALRRYAKWIGLGLAALALLACWLGQAIRADLVSDFVLGTSQAGRWWPLTWPVLQICANSRRPQRREYADRMLLAAPWPWGERRLEQELRQNPSRSFPDDALSPELIRAWHFGDIGVLNRCLDMALNALRTGETGNQYDVGFLRAALTSKAQAVTAERALTRAEGASRSRAAAIVRALADVPPRYVQRYEALRVSLFPTHQQQTGTSDRDQGRDSGAYELILEAEKDPRQKVRVRDLADHHVAALCGVPGLYLDEVAEWFPHSRFGCACTAYGKIRGHDYDNPTSMWDQAAEHRPFPPAEEYRRWAEWLKAYPEHPAADDATYWMGRCLEWQNMRVEAFWHYVDMVGAMPGDQDMLGPTLDRVAALLDIAASDEDVAQMRLARPNHRLAPALQYTLAVRLARCQRFDDALRLTANLRWAEVQHAWDGLDGRDKDVGLDMPMDYSTLYLDGEDGYITQRHVWEDMAQVAHRGNPLELARAWASPDGWKAGYLIGGRGWHSDAVLDAPYNTVIRDNCRHRNAQANAWALLDQVRIDNPDVDLEVTLLRIDLLDAIHLDDWSEKEALKPLSGIPPAAGDDYDWCERHADRLYQDMVARFPARPASGVSLWSDIRSLYQDWRSQPAF